MYNTVRGFVTGSTDTSLWTVYNKGVRRYCGNDLPDGRLLETPAYLSYYSIMLICLLFSVKSPYILVIIA